MSKNARKKMNVMKTYSAKAPKDNDVLMVAPKNYRDLPDLSDDYDISAKLNMRAQERADMRKLINQSIDGEDLMPYGPSTNYKSKYSYNRDN